ncbi:carbohydrate ABC transporter permease [Sediminispirochaeta bajacaliforniensis]|uniref:carbohydrate ABC transporter permease n=1 Tax=Sediminispirochaeta bajacaliforniensis TaxID=148 RepID=UPI00035D972A|nr:sugar ABC transporter permease [Sediminispirochaeta bajacaliforniensis]
METDTTGFIKTKKNRSLMWFLVPITVYLLFFFLYPVIYDIYISFFDYRLGSQAQFVGFGNYRAMLNDSQYMGSLITTMVFVVAAVVAELVLGMIIALLLNNEHPLMQGIRTIILIPTVFTPLVAGLVWKALYHPDLGMYTYYLRKIGLDIGRGLTVERSSALFSVILVDVWEWTPLMVIVILAGLKSLPKDPYEAAMLDGASRLQIFFRITLPLLRPTLVVALLIRTLDALKIFDIIWAITGGGPGTTTTVANLRIYEVGMQHLKIGYAAALSNVLLVFGVIAGVFFVQSLYKGKEA